MKDATHILYLFSFFATLALMAMSYLSFKKHKEDILMLLTEFWGALCFNVILAWIFAGAPIQYVALTMVGWIWPARIIRLMLEKVSGEKLDSRRSQVALALGAFFSVALATFGHRFVLYALPFSLGLGGVGLWYVGTSWRKQKNPSVLMVTFYVGTVIFFISKLAYPWWRMQSDYSVFSAAMELVMNLLFAASTLALALELVKGRHEDDLERLVKERDQKLIGQSKYSELGMMSAGIAHEINNPLAIIQARTTQLLRMYKDGSRVDELGEGLAQILYTSERINRTIQGVREFVHQDENNSHRTIGLKDLIDDVLVFCGQRLKNHGVNLRFYGLENYPIRGNKIQLEQVILNLINNSFDAIEFLPDKWIELSVSKQDDRILLFVKDSGAGIPPEVASRMMEPFFSTKELRKGTGLGLALTKGIVEQHGGNIRYLPDVSHTTFLIDLPTGAHVEFTATSVH